MRQLGMCAAIALLCSAGSAFALTATLAGGGLILVDVAGHPGMDLAVDMSKDGSEPGDGTVIGTQMDFKADAPGISIVADEGYHTTRYNPIEWDSSTAGLALNPKNFDGPMAANTDTGPYGTFTEPFQSDMNPVSNLGYLHVTLAPRPPGTIIHLNPVNVTGFDGEFLDFPANGVGVTFQYGIPEPASVLLLLGALPFMRRHRTA